MDEWIKTMVHAHNETLPSPTREGNPTICDDMDEPEDVMLKLMRPGTGRAGWHDLSCI